jgi:hypothetical protein
LHVNSMPATRKADSQQYSGVFQAGEGAGDAGAGGGGG